MAQKTISFELAGPRMSVATVDTIVLLRCATAFFEHLQKVAEALQVELTFEGIWIKEKCVSVEAMPNSVPRAKLVAQRSTAMLAGRMPTPRGVEGAADRLRRSVEALPANTKARIVAGKWKRAVAPPEPREVDWPWEVVELRARPIRVGGKESRTAIFTSPSEPGDFVLKLASAGMARRVGAVLYDEVDIEAMVRRGVSGEIVEGRLVEVHDLEDGEPMTRWSEWFSTAAAEWNDIDDIEAELERLAD